MRRTLHRQRVLIPVPIDHEHARELAAMSQILDECPETVELVHADLIAGVRADTGQEGLSADQVMRAGVVKQMNAFSYAVLAFHLADSSSYRRFCRLPSDKAPSKSALQRDLKKVGPETWEAISRMIVKRACSMGIEDGSRVRVDCTVTETNIHRPTDSSLLLDCVRALVRELIRAQQIVGFAFSDHRRRAKRRALGIENTRKKTVRMQRYRDLVKVTAKTVGYAQIAVAALESEGPLEAMVLVDRLRELMRLSAQVLDQTRRRIFNRERVPVADKIVSIFEPHTDIIVKDRRETLYGHKLCLTIGASGLVLDALIETGNTADATLATQMIQRQADLYDGPPRQAAFDGGFVSRANLEAIKALGVQDVAFTKTRYIEVTEMVKSSWVYKRLRNFRAGIEGCISFLKRCFGLDRCNWRSFQSFKAYAWLSILTANLLIIARHTLQ